MLVRFWRSVAGVLRELNRRVDAIGGFATS
jgi:hypothetical protein